MADGTKSEDSKRAHMIASNKYRDKTYDQINFIVKKGNKERLKVYCEDNGITMNRLIVDAINAYTDLWIE